MSEILEEFEDITEKRDSKGVSFYLKIFALVAIVTVFGIYVGDMLFGKSSLDVLLNLQSDKQSLEQRVESLKDKNAILQKEYFELKDLDPENKGYSE
ncbi:septum formation initiator [Sulfurospirillum arcachonense]|uniref:septum formation initiator n=1 Tax=Sulfurospirillum arcachonense TaxID=57666 RepID=UPI00046A9D63|nr:septum formation initiator [Sulfurospirillum arcachonense]